MQNYKIDLLKLSVQEIDNNLKIIWDGECISKNPEENIGKILFDIINSNKNISKEIILDFKKLTFINSATISLIVIFLKELRFKNLKVKIDYNKSYSWQSASFRILENFTSSLDNIKNK